MGSAHKDKGPAVGVGRDDDGAILVLKVWREPAFRARITVDRLGADRSAQTVLVPSETAVLDYVRDWLDGKASI